MTPEPPGSRPPAVSLCQVTKSYGSQVAVEGLTLAVSEGELLAVLGPNGAGKTTTIEMLEGYRRPDQGRVTVLGLDPVADARRVRPQVGIMLQEGGIYPTIRVREAAQLFAGYFANPEDPLALLDRVGLADKGNLSYRHLSGGEKQRLSLALALIGRPRVLFLDEPSAGMDPRARLLTWEVIKAKQQLGVTTILTTHSMEEAEQLADRVAILNRGRLVACDQPQALGRTAGPDVIHLELAGELSDQLLAKMRRSELIELVTPHGRGRYDLTSRQPRRAVAAVCALLADDGPQINLLRLGRSSLEQVFLELTDEETP